MSAYNFVCSGRNFTKKFFVQRPQDASRQRRLEFVAIGIVPEIFAVKLERCRKTY